MRPRPTLVLAPFLLLAACSKAPVPAPGAAPDDRVFDAAAVLDPGTKGLVVEEGNPKRPTYWDFDRVPYGAQLRHAFRIRNDEGRDVRILDLLPSCGCTKVRVQYVDARGELVTGTRGGDPVLVVPAGTTFELVCEVDTTTQIERMNVDKLAQVRLRSDAPRAPFLTFELHLVVERTFRAVPAVIDFGDVPQSAGKSMRSDVSTEVPGDGARITGVELTEGPFRATVDATELAGTPYWIVVVDCAKDLPLGQVTGRVRLATARPDGNRGTAFELPVRAQVRADVVAQPGAFAFGTVQRGAGQGSTVELVALAPDARFAFLGAEAQGAGADKLKLERVALDVDPEHEDQARRWRITLTPSSDFPLGAFAGTLIVKTSHPRVPELRVPYQGVAQ